jgi:hypothetical protein
LCWPRRLFSNQCITMPRVTSGTAVSRPWASAAWRVHPRCGPRLICALPHGTTNCKPIMTLFAELYVY